MLHVGDTLYFSWKVMSYTKIHKFPLPGTSQPQFPKPDENGLLIFLNYYSHWGEGNTYVCRSEDNFMETILSFHLYMGSRDQTLFTRLKQQGPFFIFPRDQLLKQIIYEISCIASKVGRLAN